MSAVKSWRDVYPIHPAAEMFPLMAHDELLELGEDIKKNGLRVPIVIFREGPAGDDETLYVLDGRNRLDAMEAVGINLVTHKCPDQFPVPSTVARYKRGALDEETVERLGVFAKLGGYKAVRYVSGSCKAMSMALSPEGGISPETIEMLEDPWEYVLSANVHRRHLTTTQKRELIQKVLQAHPEKSNRRIGKLATVDHKTVASARTELERRGEFPHVDQVVDTKGRKQPTRKPKAANPRRDDDESLDAVPTGRIINGLPVKKVVENEKTTVVVLRWMRGADDDLHKIVRRLGFWEKKGHADADTIAEELRGFTAGLRKAADAIDHAISKRSDGGAALWADLSAAPPHDAPEPFNVGDRVEFQEAPGRRWLPAKVTAILDDGAVEIVVGTTGNVRTPKVDRLRLAKR